MDLVTDALLFAATVGAAAYCYVLASRLRRFTTLETGMGGAIAVLSAQVDDMTRALERAQGVAVTSERRLEELTQRAGVMAQKLELMVAALHDLPQPAPAPAFSATSAPRAPMQAHGQARAPDEDAADTGDEDEHRRLRFVRRRGGRSAAEALE